MKKSRKLISVATALVLTAVSSGCAVPSVTIGKGTEKAMSVDGCDISSGIFIFYTIQAYQEASQILKSQNNEEPSVKDVKNSTIDGLDATDWIQNKAVEYCKTLASVQNEFQKIGGQLTDSELDEINTTAESYYESEQNKVFTANGVGLESFKTIIGTLGSGSSYSGGYEYMQQYVFDHYYGFDGEKGCTEDELKDYFDENFARVKFISMSLTDSEGNKLSEDEQKKVRKKAEQYAKQINSEKDNMDKMFKMNELKDDYDEYVATQTTPADDESAETTTTTTTTTAEPDATQTTTTTDPYENETLVQKYTTTAKPDVEVSDGTEESSEETEETDAEKASREYKQFVFEKLDMNKATVYDYDENTIYVIIRGDLRERMTEDDYWSEDYIYNLQLLRYNDEFTEYLKDLSEKATAEKVSASFRRYAPFKLDLSSLEPKS